MFRRKILHFREKDNPDVHIKSLQGSTQIWLFSFIHKDKPIHPSASQGVLWLFSDTPQSPLS